MSVNFWQILKMTKQTILCELFFLNVKNSSWFRKTILYTLKYCKLWYFLNQFYKILSKDTGKTAPLGNILKLTADHVR